jgi:hypothetical protein
MSGFVVPYFPVILYDGIAGKWGTTDPPIVQYFPIADVFNVYPVEAESNEDLFDEDDTEI